MALNNAGRFLILLVGLALFVQAITVSGDEEYKRKTVSTETPYFSIFESLLVVATLFLLMMGIVLCLWWTFLSGNYYFEDSAPFIKREHWRKKKNYEKRVMNSWFPLQIIEIEQQSTAFISTCNLPRGYPSKHGLKHSTEVSYRNPRQHLQEYRHYKQQKSKKQNKAKAIWNRWAFLFVLSTICCSAWYFVYLGCSEIRR